MIDSESEEEKEKLHTVEINGTRSEYTVSGIYNLRKNPTLLIHIPLKSGTVKKPYYEFAKLATVRNLILALELRNTPPKEQIIKITNPDIHTSHHTTQTQTDQPKMDDLQFLKLALTFVPRLEDKPKELSFFIDRVTQLNSATPANLKQQLITFVKGRARSAAAGCNSLEEIFEQLKIELAPESSDILESKLSALNISYRDLSTFFESAEKLSDEYIASLSEEGVSKQKAKQMATKTVVDLCRRTARNDTIKVIIAATKFDSPREVINKFRAEVSELQRNRPNLNQSNQTNKYHPRSNNFSGRNQQNRNNFQSFSSTNNNDRSNSTNNHRANYTNNNSNTNFSPRTSNVVRYMQESEPQQDSAPENEEAARWLQNSN